MWNDDDAVIEALAEIMKECLLDSGIANDAASLNDLTHDMAEKAWMFATRREGQ